MFVSGVGARHKFVSGVGALHRFVSGVGARHKFVSDVGARHNFVRDVGARHKFVRDVGARHRFVNDVGARHKFVSGVGARPRFGNGVGVGHRENFLCCINNDSCKLVYYCVEREKGFPRKNKIIKSPTATFGSRAWLPLEHHLSAVGDCKKQEVDITSHLSLSLFHTFIIPRKNMLVTGGLYIWFLLYILQSTIGAILKSVFCVLYILQNTVGAILKSVFQVLYIVRSLIYTNFESLFRLILIRPWEARGYECTFYSKRSLKEMTSSCYGPQLLESEKMVQVLIKKMEGAIIAVRIRQREQVRTLRITIEERLGHRVNEMKLVYNGQFLEEERRLAEYGIGEMSVISIIAGLQGGGPIRRKRIIPVRRKITAPTEEIEIIRMTDEEEVEDIEDVKDNIARQRHKALRNFEEEGGADIVEAYEEIYYNTRKDWRKRLRKGQMQKDEESVRTISEALKDIEVADERIRDIMTLKKIGKTTDTEIIVDKKTNCDKTLRSMARLTIPVFDGRITEFAAWRAAFSASIDGASGEKTEKCLHLRKYLAAEPLRMIAALGYSDEAYDESLRLLDERYGGEFRTYQATLREVRRFQAVKENDVRGLEEFANMLSVLVTTLRTLKRDGDLANGFLYQELTNKLPRSLRLDWNRAVEREEQQETVEQFRKWCQKEMLIRRRTDEADEKEVSSVMQRSKENGKFSRRDNETQQTYVAEESDCYETLERFNTPHEAASRLNNGYVTEGENRSPRRGGQKEVAPAKRGLSMARKAPVLKCRKCSGTHYLDQCPEVRQMMVDERLAYVNKERLCRNCFRFGHVASQCQIQQLCRSQGCKIKHNFLLHKREEPAMSKKHEEKQNTFVSSQKMSESGKPSDQWISLRTVPVVLWTQDRMIKVNALLDDGSTTSYINEKVAVELELKGVKKNLIIKVIGGERQRIQSEQVSMELSDLSGKMRAKFSALTMKSVVGELKVVNWSKEKSLWKHLETVEFPITGKKGKVDILIGNDFPELHRSLREIAGATGEPIARLTPLGWTCVGGPGMGNTFFAKTSFVRTFHSVDSLDEQVRRFWELEEVSERKEEFTKKEAEILKQAMVSMKMTDGRYQVNLPWKGEQMYNKMRRETVERRLVTLEKKFQSDQELRREYSKIIEAHEEKGYITRINEPEKSPYGWLLPHFPVVRRDKETTKVRIVFDAAAKCHQRCLNDYIETGPKLQNDLVKVLLRFRKHEIALVSDISEMYLQIGIQKSDRKYLRFLWREKEKMIEFEFNRLVFGLNSSPFLAQLVSQGHARKYELEFPRAAEAIIKSTYMDDTLDSVASIGEARKLKEDLITVWGKAGMEVKKWASNSVDVMKETPEACRAKGILIDDENQLAVKTLGIRWNAITDDFTFEVKPFNQEFVTKRNLLSWVARIFDPLGMLSPYIIIGKMIIQKTWMAGVGWDERIGAELERECKKWFTDAEGLRNVKVPRVLILNQSRNMQVHVFSDASKDAYGIVSYIREEVGHERLVRFIIGKGKVAPVHSVSIPRMELLGACLAVKVMKTIAPTLGIELQDVHFWTDSTDVLCWIRQFSRKFKTFVANRVSYIQELTKPQQWHYVPTKMNPADLVSRGVLGSELPRCSFWWEGPEFLKKDEEDWPALSKVKVVAEKIESLATTLQTVAEEKCFAKKVDYFQPETVSGWNRLVRVRAWVRRFSNNCRKGKIRIIQRELTPEEIDHEEMEVIKRDQSKWFEKEYVLLTEGKMLTERSNILKMDPKLDENGVLRSSSRLIHADLLPMAMRRPIILHKYSWITWLIVGKAHQDRSHCAGVSHLMADLTQKYWIQCARKVIKKFENRCLFCRKQRAKGTIVKMAPLPACRFAEPWRPFGNSAVDFAGPYETSSGRGRTRHKRYLCLFTCLQTRAVHLEMAVGLDTDAFLKCLTRFMSRRGKPGLIVSDNGTNFVGATTQVENVVVDNYKLARVLAKQEIRWIFNPPAGSHFGGVFEALIKSAKRAINIVLTREKISDEELETVFIRVEGFLNSRPLTVQTDDSKEDQPLTPNDFLLGRFREGNQEDITTTSRRSLLIRWRQVQLWTDHIWRRWLTELVPMWAGRPRWRVEMDSLQEGEVIWLIDKDTKPGNWKIGRISQVYPGQDKQTRVIKIWVSGKEMIRPVSQVFPLEFRQEGIERGGGGEATQI